MSGILTVGEHKVSPLFNGGIVSPRCCPCNGWERYTQELPPFTEAVYTGPQSQRDRASFIRFKRIFCWCRDSSENPFADRSESTDPLSILKNNVKYSISYNHD